MIIATASGWSIRLLPDGRLAGRRKAAWSRSNVAPDRLIIVVDPSEDIRDLLAKAFTLEGYRVETFAKGIAALQKIYEGKVDVVVVDTELGDIEIDRFVLASHQRAPRVPIIVVTASTSNELERQVRRNRIFYYAVKPFSLEILKTAVRDAFRYPKDRETWNEDELRRFRELTRSLVIDALEVLDEIKRECRGRESPGEIAEDRETGTDGLPSAGGTALMKKLVLLEHYLDYARKVSEGEI
jgi:CheY-like chemotaxis protein